MNYPYYNMRNNQGYGYPYNNFQPNVQPVIENTMSQQINSNYDFFGAYVKSYDEVKNYPFNCDKPLFLLDTANDKAYVKQMDNKGNPVITGFNISPLKEEKVSNIKNGSETDTEIKKEVESLREKVEELEKMISDNKPAKAKGDK